MISDEHRKNLSASIKAGYASGRTANTGKLGRKDSEETREKKRQAALGRKHSQSTKDKIGIAHKGKVQPPGAIARQKVTMKKRIEENGGGFAVGPRSESMKLRMSEIANLRTEADWQPKVDVMLLASRGRTTSPEQRENYRIGRLIYMRDNPDKLPKKMFDTVPELEFESELQKMGLRYRKQFHSSKPHYLYDFLIEERTIVEIDGPYHYKEEFHKSADLFLKRQQTDAIKNLVAGRNGFNIIRLEVGQHIPCNWREILITQGWDLCVL